MKTVNGRKLSQIVFSDFPEFLELQLSWLTVLMVSSVSTGKFNPLNPSDKYMYHPL
jgi:hypothetical protein